MVWYFFNEVIDKYPWTKPGLSSTARIMHNSDFENGVVKIMEGRTSDLTPAQKDQTKCILITRKIKYEYFKNNQGYIDLGYMLPSPSHCQQLFCQVGHFLNSRICLLSSKIEAQVFLHANSSFWEISYLKTTRKSNTSVQATVYVFHLN